MLVKTNLRYASCSATSCTVHMQGGPQHEILACLNLQKEESAQSAHHERVARSPLRPGSRARLRAMEALGF